MDELSQLLHEYGFTWEDFPESARTNSGLLRCVQDLPKELRAECLDALRDFFRVYQGLDEPQRAEMLKQFEAQLYEEFERKRWDH